MAKATFRGGLGRWLRSVYVCVHRNLINVNNNDPSMLH